VPWPHLRLLCAGWHCRPLAYLLACPGQQGRTPSHIPVRAHKHCGPFARQECPARVRAPPPSLAPGLPATCHAPQRAQRVASACRPDAVSPLWIAALKGHARAARILLSVGADPDHCFSSVVDGDFVGANFPLKAAAVRGHTDVVRELLRYDADPNMVDSSGRTALQAAAAAGHSAVVDTLLASGASPALADQDGRTPLHAAGVGGHASVVEALLRCGVDVRGEDRRGVSPLLDAAAHGSPLLVERLLGRGADPNRADKAGRTPLQVGAGLVRPPMEGCVVGSIWQWEVWAASPAQNWSLKCSAAGGLRACGTCRTSFALS
jgi:ankyrin repeat protein